MACEVIYYEIAYYCFVYTMLFIIRKSKKENPLLFISGGSIRYFDRVNSGTETVSR